MSEVTLVFLYALATALATGLGAIPFLFVREVSDRMVAYSNAIAAGLMLGASFGLVSEGTVHGRLETLGGALLGVAFILATQRLLGGYDEEELVFGAARGESARRILLMMVVMTVHSFSEGVAVGVSFGGGVTLATLITVAIAVHNVPERRHQRRHAATRRERGPVRRVERRIVAAPARHGGARVSLRRGLPAGASLGTGFRCWGHGVHGAGGVVAPGLP